MNTLLIFSVLFIIGFWLSRLIAIDQFPLFLDETIHINLSESGYSTSPLIYAELGRVFTGWWHMLFHTHAAASAWIARTATLLAVLPGLAAIIAIAYKSAGIWGAIFSALLYGFSSYHMFYERLALADPLASALVMAALFFVFRLRRRVYYVDALMTGILLFAAFGTKTSAIPYYGVPIAAALALRPSGRRWISQLKWASLALGVIFLLTAIFVLGLRVLGYDFLSNSFSYAATNRAQATAETIADIFSLTRISQNAADTLTALTGYTGIVVMLLCALAVIVLLIQRRYYLPLCLIGPAAAMWISRPQEIRYWIVFMALLLLCGAVVLAEKGRRLRWFGLGLILLWGIGQWLPFTLTAARSPVLLPLPETDYKQYVISDASGFGLSEVNDHLAAQKVELVIGALANCQGLRYISADKEKIICPRLNPNGSDIPVIAALMNENRFLGAFVVLEDSPYTPKTAPGTLLKVIQRPGELASLSIYSLTP